jgi:hypothetical protein
MSRIVSSASTSADSRTGSAPATSVESDRQRPSSAPTVNHDRTSPPAACSSSSPGARLGWETSTEAPAWSQM